MGIASKMAALGSSSTSQPTNPFNDSPSVHSAPTASSSHPAPSSSHTDLDPAVPDEPPPAYSAAPSSGSTHVTAGPSRMDFSGPPPMPDRPAQHVPPPPSSGQMLENQITGVGIGYGPRRDHTPGGGGYSAPAHPPPSPGNMRPQSTGSDRPAPPLPQRNSYGGSGTPGGANDRTPTEVPTPGRPLLRNGQLLVYPKGFMCHKCEVLHFLV